MKPSSETKKSKLAAKVHPLLAQAQERETEILRSSKQNPPSKTPPKSKFEPIDDE
jgi:hypothetical protein